MKTNISIKKKILCFIVALACLVAAMSLPQAFAKTVEELNEEYSQIEQEILEQQEKLDEVEDEIETNEDKLSQLNSQIDKINTQINILNESINGLENDIDNINSDITTTEKDIKDINLRREEILLEVAETQALMEETEEALMARMRENYVSGGELSTLELLLTSGDMETYFTRKELMNRVAENDRVLVGDLSAQINELNELNLELETQKTTLEQKEVELNERIEELNTKQEDLEDSKAAQQDKKSDVTEKQNEVKYILDDLDKDSEAYKEAIARKEEDLRKLDAQIDAAIKSEGSTPEEEPKEEYNNDGDMLWPVPGSTRLTATYPSYSDGSPHWGIDIVRTDVTTKGTPFRAAQGGEVILALNDGNWNYGFGNYCIIDHGNGVHTLYAHAQTLYVSKGDVVQKGEEIGRIGDTGNTTGPHLHFEVRIKDSSGNVSRVNPLNYVSKP